MLKIKTFLLIITLGVASASVMIIVWSMGSSFKYEIPSDWKRIRQMEIDYWRDLGVETMTEEQIIGYFNWANRTACKFTHYFGGLVQHWNGGGVDGQYTVCLDKAVGPALPYEYHDPRRGQNRCLVYSIGIRDDWSFDEAMEKYGCEIFAFDPSLNKTNHDHSERIHFYNLGIADRDYVNHLNGWTMKALDSIYRMLIPRHGAKVIDYLKIDIDWSEWDVLKQIINKSQMLGKIRQLTIEFHLPNRISASNDNDDEKIMTIQDYRSLAGLVKSIEKQMVRFESRPSPWCVRRIKNLHYYGPICFEISFHQVLPYASTIIN
jgi:hypothetical protein